MFQTHVTSTPYLVRSLQGDASDTPARNELIGLGVALGQSAKQDTETPVAVAVQDAVVGVDLVGVLNPETLGLLVDGKGRVIEPDAHVVRDVSWGVAEGGGGQSI